MSESSSTPDIITTLLTRRSIRKFTAEPVAPEIVDVLEQAAQRRHQASISMTGRRYAWRIRI
ncbi:hypothetical protein BMIN_1142 [Bifidobacterium minimum]|uniref:Nitroreductase n=1 Tax=Bifidobacterium minimum TaxID=1693 RepID=A0A087BT91_9BIFI|nr:hypothetical protein BMIN_1142 [Bifidobacterium minimum]